MVIDEWDRFRINVTFALAVHGGMRVSLWRTTPQPGGGVLLEPLEAETKARADIARAWYARAKEQIAPAGALLRLRRPDGFSGDVAISGRGVEEEPRIDPSVAPAPMGAPLAVPWPSPQASDWENFLRGLTIGGRYALENLR